MSTVRHIKKELEAAGYEVVRDGSKHEVWSNGYKRITVSLKDATSLRGKLLHDTRADIREGVKLRETHEALAELWECITAGPCEACQRRMGTWKGG